MANRLVKVNLEPVQARILASLPHTKDTQRILKGLGAKAMAHWKMVAQQQLRSTARDYVAGLNHRLAGNKAIVELLNKGADGETSSMPNMIEGGMSAFDLRETLLTGKNVKYGKDGKPYNTVPFRHGTPGSSGRNVGSPMPSAIHKEAKKLDATLSRPGTPVSSHGGKTVVYGERLHPHLGMHAKARRILEGPPSKPWHATSIYMGMIRKGKHTVGGKVQTTGYMTFRRISRFTRDGENHWMHPGIKARNFAKQVQDHIESIAHDLVVNATR